MVQPGAPQFEAESAYPELIPLRSAIGARDWPAVLAFFARLPDEPTRGFFVGLATSVPGSEDFFAEQVRRESPPGLAYTLLGARYIEVGWQIRTGKRARYVSREQFAALHDYLCRAERLLIDATAARPDNVAAWAARLTTAMGLGLGKSEARRRYDQLARTDPHNLLAQRRMVQLLCPKWSGSWETMFAFARECVVSAPPGSLSPAVLVEAHLERYWELTEAERRGYLAQAHPEVCAAAERSVGHPAYRPWYGWVYAHNLFAYFFVRAGDHRRAAYHFRAVGNLASSYPWKNSSDPAGRFMRLRAEALAKG